ncbi:MAG: EAL domain-containing protein [Polyangiaceae bacterium]|nr:EAL domain-containing protein [Polyangiaceae bacterium]
MPGPDSELRDSNRALNAIVSRDELRVVFQPIIHMHNGELFAYEALVRCSRYNSPPELFDNAVEAGCVGRLGRMIREIAVPACSGVPLFLNLHPRELSDRWLVRPDDPIYFHDHELYLEITESVPLTHSNLCKTVLSEVCSRSGQYLVIDDLGAGYSNFKYIADLEPKVVKLDRELICGLDRNPRQRTLVTSVVRLCVDLGALVVAEGVETGDEYSALMDTGAHFGQGYLFAKPANPMPRISWPPPPNSRPPGSGFKTIPAPTF